MKVALIAFDTGDEPSEYVIRDYSDMSQCLYSGVDARGYTGQMFAERGHQVTCFNYDNMNKSGCEYDLAILWLYHPLSLVYDDNGRLEQSIKMFPSKIKALYIHDGLFSTISGVYDYGNTKTVCRKYRNLSASVDFILGYDYRLKDLLECMSQKPFHWFIPPPRIDAICQYKEVLGDNTANPKQVFVTYDIFEDRVGCNTLIAYTVCQKLQQLFPNIVFHTITALPNIHKSVILSDVKDIYGIEMIETPVMGLGEYYKYLNKMSAMINIEVSTFYGSYILDSALMKIPCIQTGTTFYGHHLFSTSVQALDVDSMTKMLSGYIKGKKFDWRETRQRLDTLAPSYQYDMMETNIFGQL